MFLVCNNVIRVTLNRHILNSWGVLASEHELVKNYTMSYRSISEAVFSSKLLSTWYQKLVKDEKKFAFCKSLPVNINVRLMEQKYFVH